MKVPFSYLDRQFNDLDGYLADIRALVQSGDFTLGRAVERFESQVAEFVGTRHAIGVGSGTDALAMSLRMLDVGPGDEVITCANTFIATVGAIVMTGARPVLVDSENGYVMDTDRLEAAITPRTKAIVPVHYTGNMADMPRILRVADARGIPVVEDACQALGASIKGRKAGAWGRAGTFSFHPLKNLNVWGDAGMIVTSDDALADRLRLYRNHGLRTRDEVESFGINCRLDSLQAVIGSRLMGQVQAITEAKRRHAAFLDAAFKDLAGAIEVPVRRPGVVHVFHLYVVRAESRDALLKHLHARGVEAKVHYPIPVHRQPAARGLGYAEGSFPVAEAHGRTAITLPAHQHLTDVELRHVAGCVREFYGRR